MIVSKLKTTLALLATMGVLTVSAHAQSLEVDLTVAASPDDLKVSRSSQDDIDEDTFFSGGTTLSVKPTVAGRGSAKPLVDVEAVCRAVLADDSRNYKVRFYQGCQAVVDRRASRQARR